MRNADIAMYDAKRRGRARSAVFDESMHRRVVDRLARETELRQVVECSLLGIHYQPIIDLANGRHLRPGGAGPLARRLAAGAARRSSSRSPRRPA